MTFCYFLKSFEKLKSSGALPPDFELIEVVQKYDKGKNIFRLAYGYCRNEETRNAILWDLFGQAYRSKGVFTLLTIYIRMTKKTYLKEFKFFNGGGTRTKY